MLVGGTLTRQIITMTNFKEIAKFTPAETIAFFAEQLEDEPVFTMKEILVAIKAKNLSTVQTLDEFGKQFAKKIKLEINREDWNSWTAKLFRAKVHLQIYLETGNEQKA